MDSSFSIPGLGQLSPNETLPTLIEVPKHPSATTSTDASRDTEMADANPGQHDAGGQSAKAAGGAEAGSQVPATATATTTITTITAEHLINFDRQVAEEDVKMEDQESLEQNAARDDGMATVAQETEHGQTDGSAEAIRSHEAEAEAQSTPSSPRVTGALEAALDSLLGPPPQEPPAQVGEEAVEEAQDGTRQENQAEQSGSAPAPAPAEGEGEGDGDAHPEWEADSSPYESSSSSSSDDSSDDDDDSDVDESKLLGVEETARLLMEADGGSDDDMDGARAAKQAASVRTKNELPDEPEPKPAITIAPEDTIAPLGIVQHIVEGTQVVIEALRDGMAANILDRGTVLCKEDRSVLGVIHDTIATVHRPMYILKFRSDEEAKEAALEKGTQVWFPKSQATFVFPSQLRMEKGSDASNLHDEEVGPDEVEYSDDEQEQAHKREKKNRKRGGKSKFSRGDDSTSRGPSTAGDSNLNYGEEEDGSYNKLPRPANFGMGLPALPPPGVSAFPATNGGRGGQHSVRRGDSRGRGGRGRGYNGRGRGGGQGYNNNNNNNNNNYSHSTHPLPPQPAPHPPNNHQPPPPFAAGPPAPGQWPFPMPSLPHFGGVPPSAHSNAQAPIYPIPNWSAASTQPSPFPFPPMPTANWSTPQHPQQLQQQQQQQQQQQHTRPPPPPPQQQQQPPQQTSWTPPAAGYGMPQQYPPTNGSNPPAPAPNYQYPNYYGGQAQGNQQQRWG